jgi:lipopolysaccharide export system permease protein
MIGDIKIIHNYIGRAVFLAVLSSLVFFTGLMMIFQFLDDLPSIGNGNYKLLDSMLNLALNVPGILYRLFPMAALVGAIIGLGSLASNSELIVIRASGVSVARIIRSVVITIIPLMVIVIVMGEWVSPTAKQYAQKQRSLAVSSGQLISSKTGLWARDNNDFIHIERSFPDGHIENFERYKFDPEMNLLSIIRAKSGSYQKNGIWILEEVNSSRFEAERVYKQYLPKSQWKSQLTLENLGVVGLEPESLGVTELWRYANYLQQNNLDAGRFRLSFWQKIFQPISIGLMLVLGCSFVFSSIRHVGMGSRVLTGVLIGLGFYVLNESFGSIAIAYQLPALIGAALPLLLFSGISYWRLSRIL